MNEECRQFREQLTQILDEQWVADGEAPEIPETMRAHAATCPSCAETLRVAEGLIDPAGTVPTAPPDLADRVFNTIVTAEETHRKRPTVTRWAGVAAAAAALVLSTVFATTVYHNRTTGDAPSVAEAADTGDTVYQQDEPIVVRLQLQAPQADSVAVVGDWNEWNTNAHPLRDSDGDGVWEVEIEVRPDSEYRYQFVIDGRKWVPDPSSPITVDDGFGGENSVLNI